jgi:hypothetical protein
MAQQTEKQKEIGLVFSGLNNFGLTFKAGTTKSLWRFNTLIISGNSMDQTLDSSVSKSNSMGFGITLGKEYRKEIVKNLELRYGADLSFTYTKSKSDYNDKTIADNDRVNEQITYKPGINLVFGFNYVLNDNFVIGAELLPAFYYSTGTIEQKYSTANQTNDMKGDISGFNYGISNTSLLLSLVYRL